MRTTTLDLTKRWLSGLHSSVPRRLWVLVLAIGVAQADRVVYADHTAYLTGCCGSNCAGASCTLNAAVNITATPPDCMPKCMVTATLAVPDTTCSVEPGPFKFVRVVDPDTDICGEDTSDPFEFEFPRGTPFPLTHGQMCTIMDPNVVVAGPFLGAAGSVSLSGGYTKAEFECNVPVVSEWGLIVLTLLVLGAGTVMLMRRRTATAE